MDGRLRLKFEHLRWKKFEALITKETVIRKELKKAEEQWKTPREEVLTWLEHVETMKHKVTALERSLKDKNSICFSSCAPQKKPSKFIIQVKLDLLKEATNEVDLLQENSRFRDGLVISDEQLPDRPQLLDAPILVGNSIQMILDDICRHLLNPMVGIIGIQGIGGVGKTATMMNINNYLATTKTFDKIIWVTLSKDFSLEKVQNDIAMQLQVYLPTYEDQVARAERLLYCLKKVKQLLIILDDMWEPIPFKMVGIDMPETNNGCKIMLTTRSWDVCRLMKADKYVNIDVLSEKEAWELFVTKAGDNVLTPDIEYIARKLVYECENIPLLINSLGHAMKGEVNIDVWYKAFKELTVSATNIQGMEEKNLRLLTFSYNRLKNDQVRNCFLYCAFFPEDYLFEPEELIRHWMAEDFIRKDGDILIQIDEGIEILAEIKNANMLEMFTKRGHEWLKMHDLFRDFAIHILRGEPEYMVKAGQQLKETPYFWKWADSRKISLMRNRIKILDDLEYYCPNISTLLLQDNPLSHVSPSFFTSMPAIQVLDMSYSGITELPSSVSKLVNLRVLFLQYCKSLKKIPSVKNLKELAVLNLRGTLIQELPEGMEGLVNLKSLDLSETPRLDGIQVGVISSLSRLEELQMQGSQLCKSGSPETANCLKEMRCLKHLVILTLSTVGFEDHLETIMCLQEQSLKRFTINVYGSTVDYI